MNTEYNLDESSKLGEGIETYNDYLSFCASVGISNYQTEEEWLKSKTPGFRFVNPGAIATAAGAFALRNKEKIVNSFQTGGARSAANTVVEALKTEGISKMKDFVINTGFKTIENSSNSGGGSNGKSSVPGGFGGPTNGPSDLKGTFETTPITLDLRPNLPAGVYSDTVNYPVSFASFSHITGFKIQFDILDIATKFFFDNVLVPNLQNKAQSSVNFKVDLSLLTSVKLIQYLNDLVNVLSIYYFTTSVLSYTSISTNKDRGIFALRSMITASDIDYLEQIRQLLPAFPIPPNLNNLIFWLYQTFTDGQNGQILIKLMPVGFNATPDTNNFASGFLGTNSSVLTSAITSLNRADNLQISSLLTQITPDWLNNKIFDPSPIPIYSASFSTLFANTPHTYFNGSQLFGPNVPGDNGNVFYVSLDPKLDGMVLGLSCIFNNAVGTFRPGLSSPVNTLCFDGAANRLTNRWSYVFKSASNSYQWQPSNANIESAFSRPEVARAYLQTFYYSMIPNSINVKGVSVDIIRESSKSLISWILSMDSIKSQKKTMSSKTTKSKPKSEA